MQLQKIMHRSAGIAIQTAVRCTWPILPRHGRLADRIPTCMCRSKPSLKFTRFAGKPAYARRSRHDAAAFTALFLSEKIRAAMPPASIRRKCLLCALLICDRAGSLAGRLAGCLTFAAAAFFGGFFQIAGIQRLDMFQFMSLHIDNLPNGSSTSISFGAPACRNSRRTLLPASRRQPKAAA